MFGRPETPLKPDFTWKEFRAKVDYEKEIFQYIEDCKKQAYKVNIETHTVTVHWVKCLFTQGALSSPAPEKTYTQRVPRNCMDYHLPGNCNLVVIEVEVTYHMEMHNVS